MDKSSLQTLLRQALSTLVDVLEKSAQENSLVIMSFNGGKDCTVILYLLAACMLHTEKSHGIRHRLSELGVSDLLDRMDGVEPRVRYAFFSFKAEDEFDEIVEFVAQMETELGIEVE